MNNFSHLKKLILKYRWMFGGTVAVIGFAASLITVFDHFERKQTDPSSLEKDNSSEEGAPSTNFYIVKLVLPARMSGATILVDSQPAVIAQQTPTVVTVQVERKTTGHKFTVRKGETVCTQPPQIIQENNVIIHPCQ